ncbi:amidohydrolase [Salinirubellus sp. GCM10025818]|uniref:amidohydrolase n=1 Tax=Salinirubellus TaxID=2162630 RepID=UPI0030D2384F
MAAPADLILTNAEVHTLADPDETAEAVAVRNGRIVRVDAAYEVGFLEGVDTEVIDCEGRVVLPGFVDAHTHMDAVGRRLVHADLSGAESRAEALDRLRLRAETTDEGWVQGYGYDESAWGETAYLDRTDLDSVVEDRPVAAFREDLHSVSLNSAGLDELADRMDDGDVHSEGGRPTGVAVEGAVGVVQSALASGAGEMRELLEAARDRAHELGVTGVHDMVRGTPAPRIYRELDSEGELDLRVRINYWTDHLDAVAEAGLVSNAGSEFVRAGAIKSFTDGSIGSGTAKLSEPFADSGSRGTWVVPPEELREWVERAEEAGFQFTAHAIGDEAVRETLDAFAGTEDPADARHRVEHAEVLTDELVERFAEVGAVASVQPNFLKWAREGGLYETRLGPDRTRASNPFDALLEAGVPLAFGSDTMPIGPLFGVSQAVTAPAPDQRIGVTEALRAYTLGAAYAGFDEHRMGTVERGKLADLVVLEESPWAVDPGEIAGIDVAVTLVDGEVVYRREG